MSYCRRWTGRFTAFPTATPVATSSYPWTSFAGRVKSGRGSGRWWGAPRRWVEREALRPERTSWVTLGDERAGRKRSDGVPGTGARRSSGRITPKWLARVPPKSACGAGEWPANAQTGCVCGSGRGEAGMSPAYPVLGDQNTPLYRRDTEKISNLFSSQTSFHRCLFLRGET